MEVIDRDFHFEKTFKITEAVFTGFGELFQDHPLNRLLAPEDVAQSVQFLTQSTQQLNGANLVINAAANT